MQPGRFTELFFLDEVTAFAAGHRPCALCRREDYVRFVTVWGTLHPGSTGADAMDAQLHSERLDQGSRTRRYHRAPLDGLPDGVFVLREDRPWLVLGPQLLRWTAAGYDARRARPEGHEATVITPRSLVVVLAAGWEPLVPLLHPSALAGGLDGPA